MNLSVGGAFYTRPVIADKRLATGLLLVVQTYCPEKIATAQDFVDNPAVLRARRSGWLMSAECVARAGRQILHAAGPCRPGPDGVVPIGPRCRAVSLPRSARRWWTSSSMRSPSSGFKTYEGYETPDGSQAVCGHRPGPPGSPTVLLYFHHDVQPPLDDAAWRARPGS